MVNIFSDGACFRNRGRGDYTNHLENMLHELGQGLTRFYGSAAALTPYENYYKDIGDLLTQAREEFHQVNKGYTLLLDKVNSRNWGGCAWETSRNLYSSQLLVLDVLRGLVTAPDYQGIVTHIRDRTPPLVHETDPERVRIYKESLIIPDTLPAYTKRNCLAWKCSRIRPDELRRLT